MIKPKPLKKGDTIGLIAPSSSVYDDKLVTDSISELTRQGFNAIAGKSCYGSYGYLSAPDAIRADDINMMFKNPNINGIFCIRGGYGTPRILDMLDYDVIRENPKVFLGYSDITAIHIALNQLCSLITFHGPMTVSDMIDNFDEFSFNSYWNTITCDNFNGYINNPDDHSIKTLSSGIAEGRITGGNLSLITSTIGTKYEIDTRGAILLLEEIEEQPYRIDRMLTQLRLSGKLEQCEGIILGNFNNCECDDTEKSLTLNKVIEDLLISTGKPIISDLMIGHCNPKITIPLGAKAIIDCNSGTFKLNGFDK